jgi:NAD-dependent dihydropyrimidine dehydrogenase PreA subunit
MAYKVTVDREKCNGCEECLEVCTVGMFRMISDKASPLADRECMGCESCAGVCDENAITVTDTRVALSDTCLNLLRALDEGETETGSRTDGC